MTKTKVESTTGLTPAQSVYTETCRLPLSARDITLGFFAFFQWVWIVNAVEEAYNIGLENGRG